MNKKMNKYLWAPTICVNSYILLSIFISFWGPIKYSGYDKESISMYITTLILINFLGAYIGLKTKTKTKKLNIRKIKLIKLMEKILVLVLIIKILLLISSSQVYGVPDLTGSWVIIMAQTYTNKGLGLFRKDNLFRQIDTFFNFLFIISTCITLFYWRYMNKKSKIFLLFNILLSIIYNLLFLGDQKPFMDLINYILTAYLIAKIKEGKKIFKIKNIILIVIISMVILIVFSSIIGSRKELWGKTDVLVLSSTAKIDIDNWMLKLFPQSLRYQMSLLLMYFSMGWYGLSLSLNLDFTWTYFLGGFQGINQILSQFITNVPNMFTETYLGKVQTVYHYDTLSNWCTIFPWIASDLTFIGALFLCGFVSYIYARCWKEAVKYNNPISFVLFTTINIFYIYLPANNQLFTQRSSTVSTIVILIIWFRYSKKYNIRGEK